MERPSAMNQSTLNKLILSRSLYHVAKENGVSSSGARLSIACNLLQDSVECFLLALSEHLNAGVDQRTTFDRYFELINQKIKPAELPFRVRLIALNKLRVNSKHFGLEPSKAELEPLLTTVWEFFDEVTSSTFGRAFATISLLDMLRDGESRELLQRAEAAFNSRDYANCLVCCRQALFVSFESNYDARMFLETKRSFRFDLDMFLSKVPHYARDRQYLEENVKEPTAFVIYDHNALEMDLMKNGVDPVAYWNVWRLTPEVYRGKQDDRWIVKHDLRKFQPEGIKDARNTFLLPPPTSYSPVIKSEVKREALTTGATS